MSDPLCSPKVSEDRSIRLSVDELCIFARGHQSNRHQRSQQQLYLSTCVETSSMQHSMYNSMAFPNIVKSSRTDRFRMSKKNLLCCCWWSFCSLRCIRFRKVDTLAVLQLNCQLYDSRVTFMNRK